MFDTMRSEFASLYPYSYYFFVTPLIFTLTQCLSTLRALSLSDVSFFRFNSYSRHVHARHFRCVITVGIAQMCVPAGMLVP